MESEITKEIAILMISTLLHKKILHHIMLFQKENLLSDWLWSVMGAPTLPQV